MVVAQCGAAAQPRRRGDVTAMAPLLVVLGVILFGVSAVHVAVGVRLFSPDRQAARRPPGEPWFGGPPRSEAGRYATLVGSFHALAVNWATVGAVLCVVATHPGDPLAQPLLAIVALWSAGNLFCALRWVTWNRVMQSVFVAVGAVAVAALLRW
jgi:hypothetical protein